MSHEVWGRLPRELLPLILARLPVPEITRLGCHLSKEWTMNMQFNRACDEANPNMAALLSYARGPNELWVRIFDFSKYVWLYEYRLHLTNRGNPPSRLDSMRNRRFWMPVARDGGLVCFVSTWVCSEANPLCIVVINPLTRVQHELPPTQHVWSVPPTLVYMKVDSETKGYKLVVVFEDEDEDNCYTVETYDSVSREWNGAVPSWTHIFGFARIWTSLDGIHLQVDDIRFSAFYFEEEEMEYLGSLFESEGAEVRRFDLAGDRMFVMHEKLNRRDTGSEIFFITEYEPQNSANVWVPVRVHGQCFPEDDDDDLFEIYACEDFLMLHNAKRNANHNCCILNFSTSEWHNLPENSLGDQNIDLMCRVSWNVIP